MIYITLFNCDTKEVIGESVDSGYTSIDEAIVSQGFDFITCSQRLVIYTGVAFSDYPFYTGPITGQTQAY